MVDGKDEKQLLSTKPKREIAKLDYKNILAGLAVGRYSKCPFPEDTIEEIREGYLRQFVRRATGRDHPLVPEEGKVLCLEVIGLLLKFTGDPDWKIDTEKKESFKTGVRIGYREKLPRTPVVYERKTHWHHYSEDLESGLPQAKSNYKSFEKNIDQIEKQFREEERKVGCGR